MIASVHLADVGPRAVPRLMRRQPKGLPGMRWAVITVGADLGPHLLPRPRPGRGGLVAAWDDDAALDRLLTSHPVPPRPALPCSAPPPPPLPGWPAAGTRVLRRSGPPARARPCPPCRAAKSPSTT